MSAVDAAIATLRALDDQAAKGWPSGFDLEAVRRTAEAAKDVLDQASPSAEIACEVVGRLYEPEPELAW